MGKHRTIGRFASPQGGESVNAQGYFVQNSTGVTVAGPFATYPEAWAEEDRLNAQAEAEAQRSGARPVDPFACARELAHIWVEEAIEVRTRFFAGHQQSLDRLVDCEHAIREISGAIAAERHHASEEGIPGRVAYSARMLARLSADRRDDADTALRATFCAILAKDTADRLSGAIAMDYPLPVLP